MNKNNFEIYSGKLEGNKEFLFFQPNLANEKQKEEVPQKKRKVNKYQKIMRMTDELMNMIFQRESNVRNEENQELQKVIEIFELNQEKIDLMVHDSSSNNQKSLRSLNVKDIQSEYFSDVFNTNELEVENDQDKARIISEKEDIDEETLMATFQDSKKPNFDDDKFFYDDLTNVINEGSKMETEEAIEKKPAEFTKNEKSFEQSAIYKLNESVVSKQNNTTLLKILDELQCPPSENDPEMSNKPFQNLKKNIPEFPFPEPVFETQLLRKQHENRSQLKGFEEILAENQNEEIQAGQDSADLEEILGQEDFILEFTKEDESNFYQFQHPENTLSITNWDNTMIETICGEIKELLEIFNIPFIQSAGEAEAMCAYLETINLVDGIINEDSDCFLFGAQNVYRRVFELSETIDFYSMNHISSELGLDRNKLILLALFLGSDYTAGVKGIGIVNAMEIVSVFDSLSALRRFSTWAHSADIFLEKEEKYYEGISPKEYEYKITHKNYKKQWEIPENFPSEEVYKAYSEPLVETKTSQFEFKNPNYNKLLDYMMNKLSYSASESNYLVNQINKYYSESLENKKITDFFGSKKYAYMKSSRLKKAADSMTSRSNTSKMKKRVPNDDELNILYAHNKKQKSTV